ncbi:phosphoribosyltransferase [Desulfotomaculum copahuensis]|uniref:Phosphoribosyltransferase n=1 Tax=Desulfotomaculum copahuensis TaxID=1838280 RepID=A0A1B7LAY2_9FIRM|nr:phosphoribosyltransferase family protein [Desulfotomaculum copahuensis]OAT79475.1 phosphoribosyltransferase [Desulfotomaculum copahuensis]
MRYQNRAAAGRILAAALKTVIKNSAVVLAIPRGGVVVGAEIADRYNLPLDLVIPRKVGVPANPEVALGAVAQDGTLAVNRELLAWLGLGGNELSALVREQVAEIKRRMELYRGRPDYPAYHGRQIILVDDGVATGYTVLAALRFVRKQFAPPELILAVPVAPKETAARLEQEVDRLVCPLIPDDFQAVGQYYDNFNQTEDWEVIRLLQKHRPE